MSEYTQPQYDPYGYGEASDNQERSGAEFTYEEPIGETKKANEMSAADINYAVSEVFGQIIQNPNSVVYMINVDVHETMRGESLSPGWNNLASTDRETTRFNDKFVQDCELGLRQLSKTNRVDRAELLILKEQPDGSEFKRIKNAPGRP